MAQTNMMRIGSRCDGRILFVSIRWLTGRLACLLGGLVIVGCGPSLMQREVFTAQRVKEIKFNDICELQGYFDSRPEPLEPLSEFVKGEHKGIQFGTVEFGLSPKSQSHHTFLGIVHKFYKR